MWHTLRTASQGSQTPWAGVWWTMLERLDVLGPQRRRESGNHPGRSVQAAMAFYKIPPEHVIVLHDELDLPLGKIRIKQGGGANGSGHGFPFAANQAGFST